MPSNDENGQNNTAESFDANDGDQRFDYFRVVDPKGLDGLVAKGKVDPQMAHDLRSELYDLSIRGEQLHGSRKAVFEILRETYPDLTEDRCRYLLAHLIVKKGR